MHMLLPKRRVVSDRDFPVFDAPYNPPFRACIAEACPRSPSGGTHRLDRPKHAANDDARSLRDHHLIGIVFVLFI